MPEQLLDRAQVGTPLEQMRGERVPQRVRVRLRERRRAPWRARPGAQPPPHVRGAQPPTGLGEEQRLPLSRRPSPRSIAQRRPRALEVARRSRRSACSPTGTNRVLPPLPSTRTVSASKSIASTSRFDQLLGAQARGVRELEQRAVTLLAAA